MKRVFNVICYAIAAAGLGLGIGSQVAGSNQKLLILIPYVVACVFGLLAVILTSLIVAENKRNQNTTVNLQKKDLVLQMSETYTVTKRGQVRPGEYKILATDESNKNLKVRVNDYVKEYQHNTTLILSEGDTISPRSSNIILR